MTKKSYESTPSSIITIQYHFLNSCNKQTKSNGNMAVCGTRDDARSSLGVDSVVQCQFARNCLIFAQNIASVSPRHHAVLVSPAQTRAWIADPGCPSRGASTVASSYRSRIYIDFGPTVATFGGWFGYAGVVKDGLLPLDSKPPQVVAAKIQHQTSLASFRATCRWCRLAVNPHVQRLQLAYHQPCGNVLTAACLRRAARYFPNVHHIQLDCKGMQPAADHLLPLGAYRDLQLGMWWSHSEVGFLHTIATEPGDEQHLTHVIAHFPNLVRLDVAGPHEFLALPLLHHVAAMPAIRTLSLLGAESLPPIPDFKRHLACLHQLQHLVLDLHRGVPPRYLAAPSANPKLTTLTVHVCQVH